MVGYKDDLRMMLISAAYSEHSYLTVILFYFIQFLS